MTTTERRSSAVPIYCASCRQEIEMPCTYVIRDWPRGCYHLGCEPSSGFYRNATRETVDGADTEEKNKP